MSAPPKETPSAAFGLSLAGGIIILLAGLGVSAVGAIFTAFIGGIGGIFGFIGIIWGILIIVLAIGHRSRPEQHTGLGVAIIIFSLLSWVGSLGGFVIGFLLALIGGILAIVWKPGTASLNVIVTSVPAPATGVAIQSGNSVLFCPNCGSAVRSGAKFCVNCGKAL